MKKMTVITPTYNRGYMLEEAYKSLTGQTNYNFKWLIIDDGSIDETEDLVQNWKNSNKIEIEYIKKKNGGKASALNLAFENLDTVYWTCLDSDDIFSCDAVEKAINLLEKIKNNDDLCGVLALRHQPNGEVMGEKEIPENLKVSNVIELGTTYKLHSEYIKFYKTSITKYYRFPEIEGEKFISPEYLDHLLYEKYNFLISRDVFCYCEYLSDGLTKNKKRIIKNNPKGYSLIVLSSYNKSNTIYQSVKNGIKYISGSFLVKGSKFNEVIKKTTKRRLSILLFPLGWIAYKVRF